jgi:hypothetical protein
VVGNSQIQVQSGDSWVVKTTETIKMEPRARQMVVSRLEWPKRRLPSDLLCVQPAQVPIEGVLVARGLSRVLTKIPDQ